MPEKILAILTQTRFPASRFEIEITETALISDIDAARVALTSLQNLGVRIALDDFGTGYSTLFHLSELRFNKLKIDQKLRHFARAGQRTLETGRRDHPTRIQSERTDDRGRHRDRRQSGLAIGPGVYVRSGLSVRARHAEGRSRSLHSEGRRAKPNAYCPGRADGARGAPQGSRARLTRWTTPGAGARFIDVEAKETRKSPRLRGGGMRTGKGHSSDGAAVRGSNRRLLRGPKGMLLLH